MKGAGAILLLAMYMSVVRIKVTTQGAGHY
jgi:hypothetical protein